MIWAGKTVSIATVEKRGSNHAPTLLEKVVDLVGRCCINPDARLCPPNCCPGPQTQKKLSVGVVINTSDYKWISLLLKECEKRTGIKIEESQFQTTDYVMKYTTAFKAKRPQYDVIMMWDLFLPPMVAGNHLAPLDGSSNPKIRLSDVDREDFFSQSLKGASMGGHLYAMPESLDMGMFYYRKDLYAQAGLTRPPRTWDELIAHSEWGSLRRSGESHRRSGARLASRDCPTW